MFDPYGQTNARSVKNRHPVIYQPITLPYLRSVANELVNGPNSVAIYREGFEFDRERVFELIFRMIVRVPNQRVESWSAFRREREWIDEDENDSGWVLRHSVWDIAEDLAEEVWRSGGGPTVRTVTHYISDRRSGALRTGLGEVDIIVRAGVALEPRPEDDAPEWSEFSLFRRFDSRGFDVWWSSDYRNVPCEAASFRLARTIDDLLNQPLPEVVERMHLIYKWTPYLVLS